ncbi:ubiquitin-protein ligase, putative [Ricinus communis]|uniref:Ubiquitin-protein ligase, putative n=1 Tax=Ricinus communis TaxID=3988 RepID=B9T3Z3_RICCO|nr:ubiquitin-protein ligase, putative [Ricinus communis]
MESCGDNHLPSSPDTDGTPRMATAASSAVQRALRLVQSDELELKIEGAKDIRKLTKTSQRCRRQLSEAVYSLVSMLYVLGSRDSHESALLALLNLAVQDEKTALTSEEGGVLAVVEILENGSVQSREHAVGALLTMCQSDRCKYREPILREGVIPGLLELTVQGTSKSQIKAQTLLQLLRETPYPRSELQADTLENIVCNIISQIDGDEQSGKAKKMLAEMVQVSMEQSLRHLQQRAALVCTPSDLPISSCTSEVSLK